MLVVGSGRNDPGGLPEDSKDQNMNELRECALFGRLPESCPADLQKLTAAWDGRVRELLSAIAEAEAAMARRYQALKNDVLPTPSDRKAPKTYAVALEALQEHLATLEPIRAAVAETLATVMTQARTAGAKTAANIAGKLVTLGYPENEAQAIARRHPDVSRCAMEASRADSHLCSLPNPKGGSVLHLAFAIDTRLAELEKR